MDDAAASKAEMKAFRRHLLVGAVTYLLTVSALHLFLSVLGWSTVAALVVLHLGIFVYGFILTRRFIYKGENGERYAYSPQSQAKRYALCLFAFRLLDGGISFILIDWMGISYFVVPLMVTGGLFILKFFVYRRLVFPLVKEELCP